MSRGSSVLFALLVMMFARTAPASAQVLGTFSWQTQPHCNVLTVTVIQQGARFQLVGTDDLCGAGTGIVTGTAVPAGAGVLFGMTVANPNGGTAHLSATISMAGLSGTWKSGGGMSGSFVFGGAAAGTPRPTPLNVRGYGQVRVVGILPGGVYWDMVFVGEHPGFISARTPGAGVTCLKPDTAILSLSDLVGGFLQDASGNDTRLYFNASFGCNADEVRVVQKLNFNGALSNQAFNVVVP